MEGYAKILVPLDGSAVAEAILPEAEKVAIAFKSTISLLRVAYAPTVPGTDPTEAQVAVVQEAEEYLHGIEQRLQAKGFSVDSHVRYGDEAEEILDHCTQHHDIDLIAMSTHGRSGVKRWILGSVAEKVLRHATKPIFLVRAMS